MAHSFIDDDFSDLINTLDRAGIIAKRNELEDCIASIELQIDKYTVSGTASEDWLRRARAAKTINGRKVAFLNAKLSELKQVKLQSLGDHFIDAARQELCGSDFDDIMNIAKRMAELAA